MTPLRRYHRADELVSVRDCVAGTTRYCHYDHQGTVQALTDKSGAVTDRFASDAFGVQVKHTGTSINRHWYIGRPGYYRHLDQALDYVRARYYGPSSGRWLSRDPAARRGASGRYSYAGAAPARLVDPSGLWQKEAVHRRCTAQWATETYIPYLGPCCPYLVFRLPRTIGDGAAKLDDWQLSALFVENWPMHFNYRHPTDWPKVIQGVSLNGQPDTRVLIYKAMFFMAVLLAESGSCHDAMIALGMGLHSIEDEDAHMDLTPVEHRHFRNVDYVDNPDYNRGHYLGREAFVADISILPQFANAKSRWWAWNPGRARISTTESKVRVELGDYLEAIKETKCVACRHKPPPVGPECPPRRR